MVLPVNIQSMLFSMFAIYLGIFFVVNQQQLPKIDFN